MVIVNHFQEVVLCLWWKEIYKRNVLNGMPSIHTLFAKVSSL